MCDSVCQCVCDSVCQCVCVCVVWSCTHPPPTQQFLRTEKESPPPTESKFIKVHQLGGGLFLNNQFSLPPSHLSNLPIVLHNGVGGRSPQGKPVLPRGQVLCCHPVLQHCHPADACKRHPFMVPPPSMAQAFTITHWCCLVGLTNCVSNRAAAQLKMELYRRCLSDSNSAINLDKSCVRAYILKGNIFAAV